MQIIVGRADCRVGKTPGQVLVTHDLGSGIGLAIYDPKRAIGGLLHYMLPDSTADPTRVAGNPYVFADTGVPLLLKSMCEAGADKRRLVALAVGGAPMPEQKDGLDVGKQNFLALRKSLWKAGVLLSAKTVPESNPCTLSFEIESGRLVFKELGEQRELVSPFARHITGPAPLAPQ